MISEVDAPIEFEVSVGNYGNKLDDHIQPSVSTTQPTNAVFDGCCYYYLPWSDKKPCISVDCHWEDVLFRLERMNLLQSIADRLVMQPDTCYVVVVCGHASSMLMIAGASVSLMSLISFISV